MEPIIILNRISTPDGTVLTSYNQHDYKNYVDTIDGETYTVDGGLSYLKRSGSNYKELSVYSDASFDIIRNSLHRYNRNSDSYVLVKDMSDSWIENLIEYLEGFSDEPSKYLIEVYTNEQQYRISLEREEKIKSIL